MYVSHPEYSDILVNLDTHKKVDSNDNINDYLYDEEDNMWRGSEIDVGFELFPVENNKKRVQNELEIKERFISIYCKYNEELGKYVYDYN